MFKSTGRLIYDPYSKLKAVDNWLIVKTNYEISRYYQYWLKKNYDLSFDKTEWNTHISVVRGTPPFNRAAWRKYQNQRVGFSYSHEVYRHDWFFCLEVKSPDLEEIRAELGLPRTPYAGFHLTVGRISKPFLLRKKELWNMFVAKLNIKNAKLTETEKLYPLI